MALDVLNRIKRQPTETPAPEFVRMQNRIWQRVDCALCDSDKEIILEVGQPYVALATGHGPVCQG